jgi:CRP-like cAMP-binding protein
LPHDCRRRSACCRCLFGVSACGTAHFATKAADVHLRPSEWLCARASVLVSLSCWKATFNSPRTFTAGRLWCRHYGPGEFFGELPNLLGTASGVSIQAVTKCGIARFDLQQLQKLIQDGSASKRTNTQQDDRKGDAGPALRESSTQSSCRRLRQCRSQYGPTNSKVSGWESHSESHAISTTSALVWRQAKPKV